MRLAAVVPLAIACILFAATSVESQDPSAQRRGGPGGEGPGRISGRVTDGEGQALSGVGVTIQSASDSAVVTEVATETSGAFRIDGLPLGSYTLGVSLIGYRRRNSEVIELNEEQPEVDLGEIVLEVAPVELDAVEADAERSAMVVEADRTVYNTDAMPAAEGTAIDVLRAVPELEIDVEDNVKLRGNQSVQIHMNGRPAPLQGEQLANFLRQLPGDQIDRVEVMPNPSAKHDPEGSGGIVNIVLKEDLNLGLSGSVSANASTRNRQYFNGRLNYQRGRLTMFTGAGVSTYRNEMSF
ncbi:MAG: carboxypeptidase regulatory-like domain-containing protein [Longimicrobiales bacterium]